MKKSGIHVVVGAGGVGSALANLLAEAGQEVFLVTRNGSDPHNPRITPLALDVKNVNELLNAIPNAEAIYNCVNPPYHKWAEEWPPIGKSFVDYAEKTGAVLVTCSNLYGYGPVKEPMTELTPLNAKGVKGRVRAEQWKEAKRMHDEGRIRATEVRGSDYMTSGMQSRLGDRVLPKILAGKSAQVLGEINQPHTWTSPVDVARLMQIVALDSRAWGKPWHVPSNSPKSQKEAATDLARLGGKTSVKISKVPNSLFWLLGLFNPDIRAAREVAYQMNRPYIMDDSAARRVFGMEPTAWEEVLKTMIAQTKTVNKV